eukprot:gene12018-14200_t
MGKKTKRFENRSSAAGVVSDVEDESQISDAYSVARGDEELPLRILDQFTLCSAHDDLDYQSLEILDDPEGELDGEVPHLVAYGVVLHPKEHKGKLPPNYTVTTAIFYSVFAVFELLRKTAALLVPLMHFARASGTSFEGFWQTHVPDHVKVMLAEVKEWCIDYSDPPSVWLLTNHAWYKLRDPSKEYEPFFSTTRRKFDLCISIASVLEANPTASFDAVCANALAMKSSSGETYTDSALVEESAFILAQLDGLRQAQVEEAETHSGGSKARCHLHKAYNAKGGFIEGLKKAQGRADAPSTQTSGSKSKLSFTIPASVMKKCRGRPKKDGEKEDEPMEDDLAQPSPSSSSRPVASPNTFVTLSRPAGFTPTSIRVTGVHKEAGGASGRGKRSRSTKDGDGKAAASMEEEGALPLAGTESDVERELAACLAPEASPQEPPLGPEPAAAFPAPPEVQVDFLVQQELVPDLLMVWDFVRTFSGLVPLPSFPLWRLEAAVLPTMQEPVLQGVPWAGPVCAAGPMVPKHGVGVASAKLLHDVHDALLRAVEGELPPDPATTTVGSKKCKLTWQERVCKLLHEKPQGNLEEKAAAAAGKMKRSFGEYALLTPEERVALLKLLMQYVMETDLFRGGLAERLAQFQERELAEKQRLAELKAAAREGEAEAAAKEAEKKAAVEDGEPAPAATPSTGPDGPEAVQGEAEAAVPLPTTKASSLPVMAWAEWVAAQASSGVPGQPPLLGRD